MKLQWLRWFVEGQVDDCLEIVPFKEREVELVTLARSAQIVFHHSIIARRHKVRHNYPAYLHCLMFWNQSKGFNDLCATCGSAAALIFILYKLHVLWPRHALVALAWCPTPWQREWRFTRDWPTLTNQNSLHENKLNNKVRKDNPVAQERQRIKGLPIPRGSLNTQSVKFVVQRLQDKFQNTENSMKKQKQI